MALNATGAILCEFERVKLRKDSEVREVLVGGNAVRSNAIYIGKRARQGGWKTRPRLTSNLARDFSRRLEGLAQDNPMIPLKRFLKTVFVNRIGYGTTGLDSITYE